MLTILAIPIPGYLAASPSARRPGSSTDEHDVTETPRGAQPLLAEHISRAVAVGDDRPGKLGLEPFAQRDVVPSRQIRRPYLSGLRIVNSGDHHANSGDPLPRHSR